MLTSMFENLNKNSKYKMKFVVFVAETDQLILNETIIEITKQFPAQIQNNMLQVSFELFLLIKNFFYHFSYVLNL